MLNLARSERGFSLIELMVTIAVFSLLVALGFPSISQYMSNSKVMASAQMFYVSAQQARTEAIRRNTTVELVITGALPTSANVASGGNTSGPNWLLRTAAPGAQEFIEGKLGAEGGGRAGGQTPVEMSASASIIQFNATGGINDPAVAPPLPAIPATNPVTVNFGYVGGQCEPAGTVRCLRVVVAVGGQTRLCDPQVAAGDTRAC